MGNQLTGIAPSQILPVEQYLTEATGQQFDCSLGSTRFFKVARALGKEGYSVVKVFVIHDPSLPLNTHKERIEEIRLRLQGASNCLPFQHAVQSEKAALLFRQYVKDSLYDRISTRPFFIPMEKKWIAFQLLCALNQCHKLKVCHGDIKMENCLVTSWNWLLLADFASFKPTYLPEDNPSDFNYFFDTSRRRTCYIAPERFVESASRVVDGQTTTFDLTDSAIQAGDLTPPMDIFSAGCVIAELFTEGTPPFDFSQLLSYRNGDYSPWKVLEMIQDVHIRELVHAMIQKDPTHRLSTEEYLIQQRGKAFPEYFYTFLKLYLQRFSTQPIVPCDEKISRVSHDLEQIKSSLNLDICNPQSNTALAIILSFVMSNCRNLKYCSSKILALELLTELSAYLTSDLVLDRIIPFMLYFVKDGFARVRAEALRHLTKCVSAISVVPRSDANIFPEYILPNLANLTLDPATLVRVAYAENIAKLADTALRVLEMMQVRELMEEHESASLQQLSHYQTNYDRELLMLQEMIQQKVVTLLSDPENVVKQVLMESGITQLCVFFGRQKANDILLSHMITFLNDKQDWRLRASFFSNIIGVATYVGWQSASILKPLLQQGLSDPQESVIHEALGAITSLTELSLIQKPLLYDFTRDVVPLLAHPCVWIKQGAVGFISATARVLNIADVHCRLLPQVQPFLKHPIIQLDEPVILLNALTDPIPKAVYDYIMRSANIETTVFTVLEERHDVRRKRQPGHVIQYPDVTDVIMQVMRKLTSLGLTEEQEDKLLTLSDFIMKIHCARAGSSNDSMGLSIEHSKVGEVNLVMYGKSVTRRHAELERAKDMAALNRKRKKDLYAEPTVAAMNAEWKSMFGSETDKGSTVRTRPKTDLSLTKQRSLTTSPSLPRSSTMVGHVTPDTESQRKAIATIDKQTTITRYANCKLELRNLVYKCRAQYLADIQSKDLLEGIAWESRPPPSNWRPRGLLVAHMHEHRASVNRICVSHDHTMFATCSNDGTVKLWDTSRLEGKSVANRSQQTYNKQGGKITSVLFVDGSTCLASASLNGSLHTVRIETGTETIMKLSTAQVKSVEVDTTGHVVDIAHYDTGAQSVLVYATVYGYLIAWDFRSPDPAWTLKNNPKHGLITSLAIERSQSWMSVGTSSGALVCWDMRFTLPITTINHPTGARVRRLAMHPSEPSWLISAVQGNNEISMWDMETGAREKTLWASSVPALSQSQASSHSIHGLYIEFTDSKTFMLTGGSDMRLRYWDLTNPGNSFIVSGAAGDAHNNISVAYRLQVVDGTEVIQEMYTKRCPTVDEGQAKTPDTPATGHRDIISDVKLCQSSQCFVISASRDGVVKVWK